MVEDIAIKEAAALVSQALSAKLVKEASFLLLEEEEEEKKKPSSQHSSNNPKPKNDDKLPVIGAAKHKNKNVLTKLIPGYVAPMKLEVGGTTQGLSSSSTGSNNTIRKISDLRKKSEGMENHASSTLAMKMATTAAAPPNSGSFKMGQRQRKKSSDIGSGKGWFHMQPTEKTEEVMTDLAVLRMRHILDPKRFYKSNDKTLGKSILQVGTVIEGTGEYYSNRLTKKQRRANITEELMADSNVTTYAKKKFLEIQHQKETKFYPNKKKKTKN